MTETKDQKDLRELLCAPYKEFKSTVKIAHKNELHLFWRNSPYVVTVEQVGSFWWFKIDQTGIETFVTVLEVMMTEPDKTIHCSDVFNLTDIVVRAGIRNIIRYWREEGTQHD